MGAQEPHGERQGRPRICRAVALWRALEMDWVMASHKAGGRRGGRRGGAQRGSQSGPPEAKQ
eukprot:6208564-Pleurochrysis_carterae.AAC.7